MVYGQKLHHQQPAGSEVTEENMEETVLVGVDTGLVGHELSGGIMCTCRQLN